MDNGEEIQGLNESWTFMGAKAVEWIAGLSMMMVVSETFHLKAGASMPILLMFAVGTPLILAQIRKRFPDEERGLMNYVMDSLGFAPPGNPPQARIQPFWSGAPMSQIDDEKEFMKLGFNELFPNIDEDAERLEARIIERLG